MPPAGKESPRFQCCGFPAQVSLFSEPIRPDCRSIFCADARQIRQSKFSIFRQVKTAERASAGLDTGACTIVLAALNDDIVAILRHLQPDGIKCIVAARFRQRFISTRLILHTVQIRNPADKDIAIPRERIVPQVERFFLRIDNYFLLCHPIQCAAVALECDRHVFPIAIQSRHQSIGILIAPIGNSLFAGNWKTIRNSRIALNAHITGSKI